MRKSSPRITLANLRPPEHSPRRMAATFLCGLALVGAALLGGCGLSETAATAAAGAGSDAAAAANARQTEANIQRQIEAAQQEEATRRAAAERESE
jgi:predicted benzoate:H+ symporter BenE